MTWEEQLFSLLDDLEQQAEAAYDAERDVDLADRSRAEYAQVTLASRLMASLEDELGARGARRRPGPRRRCAGSATAGAWCAAPARTGCCGPT